MSNKARLYVLDSELDFMKLAYSNLTDQEASKTFIRDIVAIKKGLLYLESISNEEAELLIEEFNEPDRCSMIN